MANKGCNCAHASAVNSKGFVELAATIIDIVIPKVGISPHPAGFIDVFSQAMNLDHLHFPYRS